MEQSSSVRSTARGSTNGAAANAATFGARQDGEIPPVLDGRLPLQPNELVDLLHDRAQLAANWFLQIQRPNGAFFYTYDPARDYYGTSQYNEVRHAGATYALFQACQCFDDPALRACASRAAEYIVDASISVPSGGAAFLYEGKTKLGGMALAIIALLEGRQALATDGWDEVISALAEFMLGLELPSAPGRYFQAFDARSQQKALAPDSNYYPGEALLALTRLHRAFPGGPWLAAAQRAAHYLIRVKDGDQIAAGRVPRIDHWLTMALSELARFDPNPDFLTIVQLQTEAMSASHFPANDPQPWRIGAARREPTPNFTSSATHAEALNAAWALARHRGEREAVERRSQAALRTIQFLLRMQYTEANTSQFAQPERAIGGWAQDSEHPQIRFDYVQHNLSAMIGVLSLLQAARIAKQPPAPTPSLLSIVEAKPVERHNLWSTEAVLRSTMQVDLGLLGTTGEDRRAVVARLAAALDRLPGDSTAAFDDTAMTTGERGRSYGAMVGQVVLAMQQRLGDSSAFLAVWPGTAPDQVELAIGHQYKQIGMAAARLAVRLVNDLTNRQAPSFDLRAEFDRQVAANYPRRDQGVGTLSVLAASRRRGIPIRSMDLERGVIELGSGAWGRRYWNFSTSGTSHHGVKIAKDKYLASQLLRNAGLPAPKSAVASTVEQAVRVAAEIGYPVVLKPNNGNKGRDVYVDIQSEIELKALIDVVRGGPSNERWLIEQFVEGHEHRVLVIGGQVAGVNRRIPASVIGNGSSTVRQLIDELNADPARSRVRGSPLKPVSTGSQLIETLRRQGLSLDSVPNAGQLVRLNAVSNVSAGGSTQDVTDRIHPDNARVACMAAEVVGLDFAGIDLVVPDIERSIWETGGGIVEINSHPGIIDHLEPTVGTPRDIGERILGLLYPPGQQVRAKIVTVLESGESADVARLLARLLATAGWKVGCATRDGLSVDGMELRGIDSRHPHGMRVLLDNPAVEIAILEIGRAAIECHGLGFDACDVVVLGGNGLDTAENGFRSAEHVLVESLDAAGAIVQDALASGSFPTLVESGHRIVPFASRRNDQVDTLRGDGLAVVLRGRGKARSIAVVDAARTETVVPADLLAAMTETCSTNAVMAAIAAALALEIDVETIQAALQTMKAAPQ